ncbi:LAQU0S13e01178g1_1 [Lachancea quebecensis]|uniref:LAQU0S13e01178g1_1 n=1 Tax=Lachancea quebecensis TaxID=1654605 RepID=A0A0N7MM37_9SACH|nr:LAQU0S13e01178g1_1 [Lachancea quebecensis]
MALVQYIPRSTLWLCPMFLIGCDLIANVYGRDSGRASVRRSSKRTRTQREKTNAGRRSQANKNDGILHKLSEFSGS